MITIGDKQFTPLQLSEIRALSYRNVVDRFKLIKEDKSKNPFMQYIGKSEFFNPGSGVTHRDLAND